MHLFSQSLMALFLVLWAGSAVSLAAEVKAKVELKTSVVGLAHGLVVLDGTLNGEHLANPAPFEIHVIRTGSDSGTLAFFVREGGKLKKKFQTKCWWDPKNVIPAKTYTGCSTTIMKMKRHKAVYLPDEQTGKKGIFIHPGSSPHDSAGCIVIGKKCIETIFRIVPKNKRNITVKVIDRRITIPN